MSNAALVYDTDEDEATKIAGAAGGLDTAFNSFVQQDAPGSSTDGMTADEWFVGVNGSPIGPIRLAELRAKAASGAVTLESLVWRDGYEEWLKMETELSRLGMHMGARRGGSASTEAKKAAARANGLAPKRPRKKRAAKRTRKR